MSDRESERRELAIEGDRPEACPFCGSGDLGLYEYTYARHFAVACHDCGAHGPRRPDPEEARALWDARAA
jgi:Lar family restriction alleviation protein